MLLIHVIEKDVYKELLPKIVFNKISTNTNHIVNDGDVILIYVKSIGLVGKTRAISDLTYVNSNIYVDQNINRFTVNISYYYRYFRPIPANKVYNIFKKYIHLASIQQMYLKYTFGSMTFNQLTQTYKKAKHLFFLSYKLNKKEDFKFN